MSDKQAITYLYVKTHKKTGLKYLGKTSSKDPHKYKGSGKYWRSHLKVHGNDVDTMILRECQTSDEVKKWGTYYSKLWNVVEEVDENGKKTWANLKDEEGQGFGFGKFNPMNDPEIKKKQTLSNIKSKSHPDSRKKTSESAKLAHRRPETKEKFSRVMLEAQNRPEVKAKRSGNKHHSFDNTIYTFVHVDGITETSTRYDFYSKYNLKPVRVMDIIKGNRKSHNGWSIKK